MHGSYFEQAETIKAELKHAQNKIDAAHGRSRAILNRADAAKRDLTADEQAELDHLTGIFDRCEQQVLKLQNQLDEIERQPQPRRTEPNPIGSGNGRTFAAPSRAPEAAQLLTRPRSFNALFAGHAMPADPYGGQFKSLGELARAVIDGHDARLLRNATMTSTSGTDGGFAVPIEFLGPILDAALTREVVRPNARVIPMAAKTATAGIFDYTDGTSSKRAGLQIAWGGEAAALTEQKGKLREINLAAHKGSIFIRVSNELLSDAPNFDRQLNEAAVAAVASGLDLAFISGSGAGQPLGILNAPNLVTVAAEGGQAADTVLLQNLAKMVGRLSPASYSSARWLVHPTCVPQLYLMSYTVKNVAGTENVGGTAAQAITMGPDGSLRIFGLPAVVTDACAPVGDVGDLILADLSRYIVGLRAEATILRDQSRYFDSDETAFRLIVRVDGQPADAVATKLRDGTNTVSPFVTLAAR